MDASFGVLAKQKKSKKGLFASSNKNLRVYLNRQCSSNASGGPSRQLQKRSPRFRNWTRVSYTEVWRHGCHGRVSTPLLMLPCAHRATVLSPVLWIRLFRHLLPMLFREGLRDFGACWGRGGGGGGFLCMVIEKPEVWHGGFYPWLCSLL